MTRYFTPSPSFLSVAGRGVRGRGPEVGPGAPAGGPVRAEWRFAGAIQDGNGAYFEMYANLAASLYWQRWFEQAQACDRVVLEADPGNRLARERLSRRHP